MEIHTTVGAVLFMPGEERPAEGKYHVTLLLVIYLLLPRAD